MVDYTHEVRHIMKSNTKPKYNVIQNVYWMIKLAWKNQKKVLIMCVLTAFIEVILNLTQLYIAPEILKCVEQHVSLGILLGTIAFFTMILFFAQGIKAYLPISLLVPKTDIRTCIATMISRKCNLTSYPNTLKPDFIKLRDKAITACDDSEAATESIWVDLTELLTNVSGFLIYLCILSHLNMALLFVVIITCLAGFFVSRSANNWKYAHREEEAAYYTKKVYIRRKSESVSVAKDIRIFGLQDWLNDLFDQVHDIYLDYLLGAEKKLLQKDLAEAVLAILRNGIVYVYLIHMALHDGISVPEFVLYFTATSTFTAWVMGILQNMAKLHKDSLDICSVRELLDYLEPFKFEAGEEISSSETYELKLENVSFRYPEADRDTIHGLNLTIHPSEKLAIVGLNGAGKTTLVKLLCGLFDPTEGRVLLNGKDVREFNRQKSRLQKMIFTGNTAI